MTVGPLCARLFESAGRQRARLERVVRPACSGALARRARARLRAAALTVLAAWDALVLHPGPTVLAGTVIAVGSLAVSASGGRAPRGERPAGPQPASQSASPPGANQNAHPAFRTRTVLVEVDVTVHDRQGRFVDDLGPGDFAIYENGVPQRVERVLLVGAPEAASSPRPGPVGPASSARLVPVPRVIVLVLDDGHLSPGAFLRVRRAAMELLGTLAPDDIAGVVVSGRMAGGRLTTDKAALEAALAAAAPSPLADAAALRDWPRLLGEEALRVADGEKAVLDLAVRRACDDQPSACQRGRNLVEMEVMGKSRRVAAANRHRARSSLRAWQAVADALQRFDGPKSVVLLTEGFPIGGEVDAVGRIVDAAWRAGATFYAVDARGAGRDGDRVLDVEPAEAAVTTLAGRAAAWHAAEDAVNAVAVDTGGYVARHTNDVARALAHIAGDRSACYVLAYSPSNSAADGTWRRLRVEVARKHVTVRARRGYVASTAPRVAIAPVAAAGVAGAGGPGEERARASREAEPATKPEAGAGATGTAPGLDAHAGPENPATPPASSRGGAAGETDVAVGAGRPAERPAEVSPPTPDVFPRAATVPGGTAASAGAAGLRLRPGFSERVASLAGAGASSGTTSWTPAAERDARLGWAAYERGDVERARRHLEAAAASGYAPSWVHYAFGQAAFATGAFAQAAAAWERVRTAAPDFKPVYLDLVDAHLQLRQNVRALKVLEEAARRWPEDTEIHNATGVIHLARGSVEAAVKAFERAVAVRPDEALGHFNLGRAYETRFVRSARFVRATRQWYRDEDARRQAALHYRRHIELGGAFARQARDGLDRLEWVPRRPDD
jgi:VWFA-related protein